VELLLDIKMKWLCTLKKNNEIQVMLIPSEEMIADTLAKPSNAESLNRLKEKCFLIHTHQVPGGVETRRKHYQSPPVNLQCNLFKPNLMIITSPLTSPTSLLALPDSSVSILFTPLPHHSNSFTARLCLIIPFHSLHPCLTLLNHSLLFLHLH
jgi:hypothetical protein